MRSSGLIINIVRPFDFSWHQKFECCWTVILMSITDCLVWGSLGTHQHRIRDLSTNEGRHRSWGGSYLYQTAGLGHRGCPRTGEHSWMMYEMSLSWDFITFSTGNNSGSGSPQCSFLNPYHPSYTMFFLITQYMRYCDVICIALQKLCKVLYLLQN